MLNMKKKMVASAVLALAGLSLTQPIDIRGIAKDPVSGKPIPGLVIVLESKKLRDTTNENGEFHLSNMDPAKKMSPLRKLFFSSERGFAMQMGEQEEVIAEIVNGAGRAVLRGQFNLDEGGWSLRPKNLAPGLYTVHLWTGSQLRALRLDIPDVDRGRGTPAWNLEKIPDGDYSAWGNAPVDSLRAENPEYLPASVPVVSWTQLRVSIEPKHKD
jgi:hypothetical protein